MRRHLKLSFSTLIWLTVIAIAWLPYVAHSQVAVPSYQENDTGNIKNAIGVVPVPPTTRWSYSAPIGGLTNTLTVVQVKASPGLGTYHYITGMSCNSDPMGAETELDLRSGSAALLKFTIPPAGWITPWSISFAPPLKSVSVNAAINLAELTLNVTGAIYCNVQGYSAP